MTIHRSIAAAAAVLLCATAAAAQTAPAPDERAAVAALEAQAAAGDADAKWNLGRRLLAGEGVDRDPVRARQVLDEAGRLGHVEAMILLGGMLVRGEGGPADPALARDVYVTAASKGSKEAMTALAELVLTTGANGQPLAVALLALAAEAGDPRAQALQVSLADQIAATDPETVRLMKSYWIKDFGPPR